MYQVERDISSSLTKFSYGGQKGYSRLLLGITPALLAWPTLALSPMTALAVQWAGFTSLWLADMRATAAGWSEFR